MEKATHTAALDEHIIQCVRIWLVFSTLLENGQMSDVKNIFLYYFRYVFFNVIKFWIVFVKSLSFEQHYL